MRICIYDSTEVRLNKTFQTLFSQHWSQNILRLLKYFLRFNSKTLSKYQSWRPKIKLCNYSYYLIFSFYKISSRELARLQFLPETKITLCVISVTKTFCYNFFTENINLDSCGIRSWPTFLKPLLPSLGDNLYVSHFNIFCDTLLHL